MLNCPLLAEDTPESTAILTTSSTNTDANDSGELKVYLNTLLPKSVTVKVSPEDSPIARSELEPK